MGTLLYSVDVPLRVIGSGGQAEGGARRPCEAESRRGEKEKDAGKSGKTVE